MSQLTSSHFVFNTGKYLLSFQFNFTCTDVHTVACKCLTLNVVGKISL